MKVGCCKFAIIFKKYLLPEGIVKGSNTMRDFTNVSAKQQHNTKRIQKEAAVLCCHTKVIFLYFSY